MKVLYVSETKKKPEKKMFAMSFAAYYDTNTSDDLAKKVRIFCFVLTTPRNAERAEAVNATWLRRCSGSMFVSSSPLPFKNTLVAGGRN